MRSRIDCTCGRIRRPRGASLSMGTTSTASSPGPTRSPRIVGLSMKSGGAASSSAWRKSSTPRPSLAAVRHGRDLELLEARHGRRACSSRSILLKTTTTGVLRSRNSSRMPSSNSPHAPASVTSTPRSVRSKTCIVRRARSSPRAPTSSMPAVSMKRTGPSGSSSIGFSTGSVVVPAKSETIETSWRVIALSRLDLPTLRRPKMPMCRRMPRGASIRPISALLSAVDAAAELVGHAEPADGLGAEQLVELPGAQQAVVQRPPRGSCGRARARPARRRWPPRSRARARAPWRPRSRPRT